MALILDRLEGRGGDRGAAQGARSDPLRERKTIANPSPYEAYIRSDRWRRSPARLAELAASGNRCRLCARSGPEVSIEVHHSDYSRLGREGPHDLCALCRECHRVVTAELRRRRYQALALPDLRDTPRLLAGRKLDDGTRTT